MSHKTRVHHFMLFILAFTLSAGYLRGHTELFYSYTIKSVKQTKENLVIKGTISIPIKKYSGRIVAEFMITGIKDKPLVGSSIKNFGKNGWYKKDNHIHFDFTLDLMDKLRSSLPKEGVGMKLKPWVDIPRANSYIRYINNYAGEPVPMAEVSYAGGGSIFVYLRVLGLIDEARVRGVETIRIQK